MTDAQPLEPTRDDSPAVDLAGATVDAITSPPQRIGRYRIERILGKGGFGVVYLAIDDQLQRLVAIKVPHRKLVDRPEDAQAYLTEARTVAALDHPNIVPVYDVGSTDFFPCFVVSKFIDGTDLASRLKQARLSLQESVELVATVAEALHHAHKQGLVHRDIKPGNILLDKNGKPFAADFGLALRELDVGTGPRFAGTPAYMSPEQARGEAHRVDGRSDIFSLGVVFYELLTGRRPFKADSQQELLEQINSVETRPPRQINDAIPKELDRICLKALSKRATERYSAAKDFAEDLRRFLTDMPPSGKPSLTAAQRNEAEVATLIPTPATAPASDSRPIKVVPKGLRSFDAHDADFFLELLPGPRDRDGLPDSLRFWKTRIEEVEAEKTFSVGLICGPSGCGKSSLVKAGLLPRLTDAVIAVYVEATAEETEARLLNGLRKRCIGVPDNLSLTATLAALRRGQGIPVGKKVVIVLDQFEQWLHAKKEEQSTDLVQALRQCDGSRVQCIVMVRDDFWMAVIRFMRELEVRLVEGHNSGAVDLFDTDHARKVLAAFGRAFGKLPENPCETTRDQNEFLSQAVSGLAQEGKVISVRLALFAEMMKGKEWTPASLKAVGGTEGVGVTFLEETFSAAMAPPEHRYHQKSARAVLKALLPESGTDIKGHMRSYDDLLTASGYGGRRKDFDDLIGILDGEIRLITPTDPEGKDNPDDSAQQSVAGQKFYQLTHDYLVPSLRAWLTRKQKETKRGRAELLLADQAVVWNARPENRQLPSLLQWLQIQRLTVKKNWTPPQRKMMGKASSYYLFRAVSTGLLLALASITAWLVRENLIEREKKKYAEMLVARLLDAPVSQVPGIIEKIEGYRDWTDPLLKNEFETSDPRRQLNASLALLPVDSDQSKYLKERLLLGNPDEILVIRQGLVDHAPHLKEEFWGMLENAASNSDKRFRAACALAAFSPEDARWEKVSESLAGKLAAQEPIEIARWAELLKPIRKLLLPSLPNFLEDENRSSAESRLIATIYGNYALDNPDAYKLLEKLLAEQSPPGASPDKKVELVKKKANIGVALLAMDHGDKVWPLLKHGPDPTLRSFLIERLGPRGLDIGKLLAKLDLEKDDSTRRAIILSLGQYGPEKLAQEEVQNLLPHMLELYANDPDPGIHGSVRWLLRKWRAEAKIREIDESSRMSLGSNTNRGWSVNSQGQTMVVVPKPAEGKFWMGDGDAGPKNHNPRHQQRMTHSFAISSEDVTIEQFRRFRPKHEFIEGYAPEKGCPVIFVQWFDTAEYCNWLSKSDGIPESDWCYEPNKEGKYADGMKIKPGFFKLRGYRLPTEAEWEYACRAGSRVAYSFGEAEEQLRRYGWYNANSESKAHPVGLLKPNDLGLFDMHCNVWQWTQDESKQNVAGDDNGGAVTFNVSGQVVCGGSWYLPAGFCRAAHRNAFNPIAGLMDLGFRVARSLPVKESSGNP